MHSGMPWGLLRIVRPCLDVLQSGLGFSQPVLMLFYGDLLMCREKKSVVVAIRGTQSIADLVTDAVVHPEPMESWVPQVVFTSFC
jgi:hypothetical protein